MADGGAVLAYRDQTVIGPARSESRCFGLLAGQSALLLHASAAAVAHVLQKQLPPVAVHGRLVASVVVPVVA